MIDKEKNNNKKGSPSSQNLPARTGKVVSSPNGDETKKKKCKGDKANKVFYKTN